MDDEIGGVCLDDTRSDWGAYDMREVCTLEKSQLVRVRYKNETNRTSRCADMAAKNGAPEYLTPRWVSTFPFKTMYSL